MSRLTVIVVSFNTRDSLRRCLASLEGVDEVIVVDNGSTDGSAGMIRDEFPSVKLIENSTNRGFGAANNQGLAAMSGEIALFLNSDAIAHQGSLDRMRHVMEDESIVACGGRLKFPDGRTQWSCCSELTLWAVFCEQTLLEKLFPRSRVFSPYWQTDRLLAKSETELHDVAQVMGACLFVRPVEKFDERFFLYCEDTELCKRLSLRGRIVYVPDAVFTHELGSSSKRLWMAIARYNRGKELYFDIHHGKASACIAFLLNRVGALKRTFVWFLACAFTLFLVPRFRSRVECFLRVLFAPIQVPENS